MLKKLLKSQFLKDIYITVFGQIVIMLIAFGINKILSINLSVGNYAVYNIMKRTSSVMAYVMLGAMGIAVPRYLPTMKAKGDEKNFSRYFLSSFLIILGMSLVVSIAVLVARNSIFTIIFGENTNYNVELIYYIIIYAFGQVVTTYLYSYYRAAEKFLSYSTTQIIVQVFCFLIVLFLGNNLGEIICLWGIGSSIYALAYLIIFVKQNWNNGIPYSLKNIIEICKELLSYGLPRVPGECVLFAYTLLPLLIVTNKFGLEQSGYFSAAISINTMVTPLFSFVGVILLPEVSKCLVNHKLKEAQRKIRLLMLIYIVLSILGILFVEMFPKFVVKILFQSEYEAAIPLIRITIISILPNSLYLLFRNPLDAISKIPYNTICLISSFIIMLLGMLFANDIALCAYIFMGAYTSNLFD